MVHMWVGGGVVSVFMRLLVLLVLFVSHVHAIVGLGVHVICEWAYCARLVFCRFRPQMMSIFAYCVCAFVFFA